MNKKLIGVYRRVMCVCAFLKFWFPPHFFLLTIQWIQWIQWFYLLFNEKKKKSIMRCFISRHATVLFVIKSNISFRCSTKSNVIECENWNSTQLLTGGCMQIISKICIITRYASNENGISHAKCIENKNLFS